MEKDALRMLGDELKLQAWLAARELRHPSLNQPPLREEIDALARLRDELRLQAHLGRLDAADELRRLDGRWREVQRLGERVLDDVDTALRALLREIGEGYVRLARPPSVP